MRTAIPALLVTMALVLGAVPAVAQEPEANAEDGVEPALCLRVTTDVELEAVDAPTLGRLLLDGGATIEVLDAAACALTDEAEAATEDAAAGPEAKEAEPGAAEDREPDAVEESLEPEARERDGPRRAERAYVDFVAHAAGAAVELAALSERYEGVEGARAVDRAARDLNEWARRQVRWLGRNPPAACYARVHRQWLRGAERIRDGTRNLRTAIDELRAKPMRRAVRQLAGGLRDLGGVDLDAVTRACVGGE